MTLAALLRVVRQTSPEVAESIRPLLTRAMANFAAAGIDGQVRIVKRKLKKIQDRPT